MSGQTGTLGKYQLIREIARSNDIVYEAYDPMMNRRVALKELAMPGGSTEQQREDRRNRFLREARAAGTLTHPNIVTVYEYGEEAGRHFIAMEYLEGHTLRNEIDTHGFLPLNRSLEIADAVLQALEYAHSRGVIHRDIKPDNIQLLPDGRVKLTDFGIARLTFEPNITMDGQVFGTPSYMSPEQVVGKEIDARSDLFGVGVVLYEMIAGKKPFGGDSVVSITYAIMNTHPDQPTQMNFPVWQVVERALEKSPQLRFSSAADMRSAIENAKVQHANMTIDPYASSNPTMGMAPNIPYASSGPSAPPPNNPYVQQPQVHPFGSVPPSQQPAVYGYNPYQGGAQGYPPPQHVQQPLPIYYPPAPRAPLFKPETKQFLSKLFITVLVLGTFFGLIIVGISSLGTAVQRARLQADDQTTLRQLRSLDSKASPADQIVQMSTLIQRLKDPENVRLARRDLAVVYERQGKAQIKANDWTAAESSFQTAAELDPTNAAYPSNLGDLYQRFAQAASTSVDRLNMWRASAQYWSSAAGLERDDVRREAFIDGAVRAYVNLANEQIQAGDYSAARSSLYDARDMAKPESNDYAMIQQMIDDLVNR